MARPAGIEPATLCLEGVLRRVSQYCKSFQKAVAIGFSSLLDVAAECSQLQPSGVMSGVVSSFRVYVTLPTVFFFCFQDDPRWSEGTCRTKRSKMLLIASAICTKCQPFASGVTSKRA